jgi:hypothetical protein
MVFALRFTGRMIGKNFHRDMNHWFSKFLAFCMKRGDIDAILVYSTKDLIDSEVIFSRYGNVLHSKIESEILLDAVRMLNEFEEAVVDWDETAASNEEAEILAVAFKDSEAAELANGEPFVDWGLIEEKIACSVEICELESIL